MYTGGGGSTTIVIGSTPITGGADTQVLFNDAGTVGSDAGFTYVKGSDLGTIGALIGVNGLQAGTTTTAGTATTGLNATMSGGSATSNFVNVTGTLPTTLTAEASGVLVSVTGAGSSSQINSAAKIVLNSGYTGGFRSSGLVVAATSDSSGTQEFNIAPSGNFAIQASQTRTTSNSLHVGVHGASSGNSSGRMYGVIGWVTGNPSNSIGVAGYNNSTGNNRVGGYFGFNTSAPTFTPAALMADNVAQAVDIFVARDNGTPVFTIADGGDTTFTGRQLGPAGAVATPTYGFSTNTTTGMYVNSGNTVLMFAAAGVEQVGISNTQGSGGGIVVKAAGSIGFSANATVSSVSDTILTRSAAAVWQLGAADAASPVAQTLRAQGSRGGTDSNVAGGNLTIYPGLGTGSAVPSVLEVSGGAMGTAAGSTQHTNVARSIIGATEVLTNNTVTALASCTLANDSVGAFQLIYGVECKNASDVQVEQGSVSFMVTNDAGAIANNVAVKYGNQQAMTGGSTLTVTFTITAANPAVISVNANSNLASITAGFPRITFRLLNLTQQAVVLA